MRVFITGGAGFIGSHVAGLFRDNQHEVAIYDNLDPQVHPDSSANGGGGSFWPDYLPKGIVSLYGDVTDYEDVADALDAYRPDVVIHLAAKVGVGQSATDPAAYVNANALGTATLLQAMQRVHKPARLIVASSMSCYGEGLYRNPSTDDVARPGLRSEAAMRRAVDEKGPWEHEAVPIGYSPTGIAEACTLRPSSIYAESKATTERMSLIWGEQQGVPVAATRLFNTYGKHQSPRNPYTGVVAMFTSAALRGEQPVVYEDGQQSRDFIHVLDVAAALHMLAHTDEPGPVNVGTGIGTTIYAVAELACNTVRALGGPDVRPKVTGAFRPGDVRHCIANTSALRSLGWSPTISLRDGIAEVVDWMMEGQKLTPIADAHEELRRAGLLREPS